VGGAGGAGAGPGVGGAGGAGGAGGGPGVGGAGGAGAGAGGGGGASSTCGATTCQPPYVCSSGVCVCSENSNAACLRAGVACGYITDNCGRQIFCSCPIAGQVCDPVLMVCLGGCTTGTGGIITTDIICPTGS
jgi:hypothetical protein